METTEGYGDKLSKSSLLYPKERIQRAVLHELCDNHDGAALSDHALQADDIGVLELSHDAGLTQEFSALLIRVASLQGLNSHGVFPFPRGLQAPKAHLSKLSCQG